MASALLFFSRIIIGLITIFAIVVVFDTIHDRNTEIIVSAIGLQYSFIFLISRRLQYFGLTVFSFLGRTSSYVQNIPYDQLIRDEAGIPIVSGHLYINVIFAAIIEVICLFRLFTSLFGRGWSLLSDPVHSLLGSALF